MKAVLICPSPRPAVALLGQTHPLALAPLMGQSLVEYWLSWLSLTGAKEVLVLAHDRPEQVATVVQDGARWGLTAKVMSESRELNPAEVRLKYDAEPAELLIEVLDHFPGLTRRPLFASYAGFFAGLREWLPFAITPDRAGPREVRPGIWVGSHSQVAPLAQVHAPCWIGEHVFVGAQAVLGPGTIIEDGSFIEPGVEIADSLIGPDTFVGSLARVNQSLAWGQKLVNWQTGSLTVVPDAFLLSALRQPRRQRSGSWLARLVELYGKNKEEAFLAWKQLLLHKGG